MIVILGLGWLLMPSAQAQLAWGGISAYQWPCLDERQDGVEDCISPASLQALPGRHAYRFAIREEVVRSQGWAGYRRLAQATVDRGGQVAVVLLADEDRMAELASQLPTQLPQAELVQAGNEPNGGGHPVSAAQYVQGQYCPAARALAAAGRGSTLATAGLATADPQRTNTPTLDSLVSYARAVMAEQQRTCPEAPPTALALHPYNPTAEGVAKIIATIRAGLDQDGARLPLLISEWGVASSLRGEAYQQQYLRSAASWMAQQRHSCRIAAAWWFGYRDLASAPAGYGDHTLALLHADGQPKPAWEDFRQMLLGILPEGRTPTVSCSGPAVAPAKPTGRPQPPKLQSSRPRLNVSPYRSSYRAGSRVKVKVTGARSCRWKVRSRTLKTRSCLVRLRLQRGNTRVQARVGRRVQSLRLRAR